MNTRDECKELIARQCAISQGVQLSKLHHKTRAVYMTLAENILATVERKAKVQWS